MRKQCIMYTLPINSFISLSSRTHRQKFDFEFENDRVSKKLMPEFFKETFVNADLWNRRDSFLYLLNETNLRKENSVVR